MNIAEIRRKAQAGKTGDKTFVPDSPGQEFESTDESSVGELLSQRSPLAPIVLSSNPVARSSAATALSGKTDVSASAEERLNQLFSWIPQQDENLFESAPSNSSDEKRIEAISRRWLVFSLGSEDYALDISVIREILKPREITEVPRVPEFLLGIITLRGNIIPIFDLKRRMGLGSATIDQDSRIIVCQSEDRLAGLLIDRITQVASIQDEKIEPPPAIFSGRDRALLDGVGRVQDKMLILLNLSNVLEIDFNSL